MRERETEREQEEKEKQFMDSGMKESRRRGYQPVQLSWG